ncbi:riboflavin synthase subunit alpha [Veronia pacifica]|uniref:riboflavin synthase subunit alpha n=1 Tax=Veronia pacifica TaxID=1080227 RepID=UPI000A6698E9|nr:riboflavin synthase subunit alpha [Veronia pacifica]
MCLTVTEILHNNRVKFDVILQSIRITTLGNYTVGTRVNAERAAKDGAEIGGHPLSGHIDFHTSIESIENVGNNYCLTLALEEQWQPYIFPKGYIALNGASLTISDVDKKQGWFQVWLIPETRNVTVFGHKEKGDKINVEIERGTQVVVDTVKATLEEQFKDLLPAFKKLMDQHDIDIQSLGSTSAKKILGLNSTSKY